MRKQCFGPKALPWLIGGTFASWVLGALPARADVEYFPYTYGWMTPTKGEMEVELKHTAPTNNHHWQDSVSLEYGVTNRYMIEPYIIFNRSGGFGDPPTGGGVDADGDEGGSSTGSEVWDPIHNGAAYRYGGFALEQRYRFGNFAYNKVLTAAYLEYEQMRDQEKEIEGKVILEYNTPSKIKLDFNLISSTPLRNGSVSWGYSFGIANTAADKRGRFWYGAEAFGNWTSTQHWVGPTAGVYLNGDTRLVGTYAKQIRGNSGDQFRLMINHELN